MLPSYAVSHAGQRHHTSSIRGAPNGVGAVPGDGPVVYHTGVGKSLSAQQRRWGRRLLRLLLVLALAGPLVYILSTFRDSRPAALRRNRRVLEAQKRVGSPAVCGRNRLPRQPKCAQQPTEAFAWASTGPSSRPEEPSPSSGACGVHWGGLHGGSSREVVVPGVVPAGQR
jgi:hypothetical protein